MDGSIRLGKKRSTRMQRSSRVNTGIKEERKSLAGNVSVGVLVSEFEDNMTCLFCRCSKLKL
jgi:sensor histidine kinase regulating citrate/malate metabolism